jgi:stearoyl-CoA desaturase (Delta-9 desaturase)
LWSHKSYDAHWTVQWFLALVGAGSVQGSIIWWSRKHRLHHRFTDTSRDPYSASEGFWYAHFGWMMFHKKRKDRVSCDISDLKANKIVMLQHKYYLPLVVLMGYIFPTLVAGFLWGDYRGGYFIAGVLRLVFVHHSTFCVNSVAHYWGDHTYNDETTPRDSIVTALLTLGEGYHNFHHVFPYDYRNGRKFYHYDPTKWLISGMYYVGLTSHLRMVPENEIRKAAYTMCQKKLNDEHDQIEWPTEPDHLPDMTWAEYRKRVQQYDDMLMVIDGLVHDVTEFADEHPGGIKFIRMAIGKDASHYFNTRTVYKHSRTARNLLSNFRVARIVDLPTAQADNEDSRQGDKKTN